MATRRTFREKKYNNNKADSFFRLNFNVYIDVKWITEKELERETKKKKEKKKKGDQFYISGEKMRTSVLHKTCN